MILQLSWYNPNHRNTYSYFVSTCWLLDEEHRVGYQNQYGHICIEILYYTDFGVFNILNYYDYWQQRSQLKKDQDKPKKGLLNKFLKCKNGKER